MKLITLAAASLAMAIAAPALAQNVEKVGTAGGRILTAAKVKAGATTVYLSGNLASPATPGGSDYGDTKTQTISIGPSEPFVNATLRPYQVDGVNWILKQYALGTGGILGDEMGLGKTIQTLSFIGALKAAGLPGPHLVVTPLAVLQNWANELKRFAPGLTFIKIHGGVGERDRLLSDKDVVEGIFDVYLTTYDTLRQEEAFFTESFLFHTITIDEGHRLKNEASSLCASLSRLAIPFRLLLTGTPLQNNLHELWALLSYLLPGVLSRAGEVAIEEAVDVEAGEMDRSAVGQARALLESLMIRRVKSEVEGSLLPKLEFVLKPALTTLQREWYATAGL